MVRLFSAGFALVVAGALSIGAAKAERSTHQFLEIALSPDGSHVASVEGDSSPWGGEPVIRTLIIRTVDGKNTTTLRLPCGNVRECWPSSPAWAADGKTLVFALRTPGSHARALYSGAASGGGLTRIVDFDGTIEALRYGPGGRLAMLAMAGAGKEVGATQAGAPVTGDLTPPVAEQRIAGLDRGKLNWVSPPNLFVY